MKNSLCGDRACGHGCFVTTLRLPDLLFAVLRLTDLFFTVLAVTGRVPNDRLIHDRLALRGLHIPALFIVVFLFLSVRPLLFSAFPSFFSRPLRSSSAPSSSLTPSLSFWKSTSTKPAPTLSSACSSPFSTIFSAISSPTAMYCLLFLVSVPSLADDASPPHR